VPPGRVLDLACGDGALAELLGPRCVGLDVSREELAAWRGWGGAAVQGRAQELPFADHTFDAVACHLAFMLFDHIERVVGELARVLRPGGSFVAVLGGGPTAEGDDQFHRFLRLLGPTTTPRFGDPRAKAEAGWRGLFAAPRWEVAPFERWELDLGGSFDEVWSFLGASYEVGDAAELREAMRFTGRGECRVVMWLARATRR